MKVDWKFSLIITLLLCTVGLLAVIPPDTLLFKIVWAVSMVSIVITAILHRKVIRPLRAIANGADMLLDRDFTNRLAHIGQPEADRIIDLFNGMMATLKLERRKLREQNHFLDLLINVSPMGIIILDENGKITGGNPAAAGFLELGSINKIIGRYPEDSGSRLGGILTCMNDKETRVVRLNDSMVYRCTKLTFMESGRHHPFILLEKLTDEVMKAERKSYEKVIRMMAHEVNNSLAGMISVIGAAAQETNDKDMKEGLMVCERRCRDMGAFISKFASAVKIPEPTKIDTDITSKLHSWIPTFESICSATGSKITINLPNSDINVLMDPVLIEQAMINIVKNAAESAGSNGEVSIVLDQCGPTIIITDNGPGIDPKAAEMLFTPFFTTKPSGHGFGLLLVSEVLNSHQCKFSLETGSDGLTRFLIRFQ